MSADAVPLVRPAAFAPYAPCLKGQNKENFVACIISGYGDRQQRSRRVQDLYELFKMSLSRNTRMDWSKSMKSKQELWDIYDVHQKRTGRTMKRNDWNMAPGDYHLTVLGVITDAHGRYLITQRKADKQWAPLCWEVPGGGVQAGETSEAAIRREVHEETGLDLSTASIEKISTYRNDSPAEKNNYFVDIYHVSADFTPADVHPQQEETEGFRMATFAQIEEIGKAGKFLHYQRLLPVFKIIEQQPEA